MYAELKCKDIKDVFHVIAVDEPDTCPLCHRGIQPAQLSITSYNGSDASDVNVVITYLCKACMRPFVCYYNVVNHHSNPWECHLLLSGPRLPAPVSVGDDIKQLSSGYAKFYEQAAQAEAYNLVDLAGMGYRKALEILIKDFCMSSHPEDADSIKSMPLAQCINKYIESTKLKALALRTAWLGNDYAHYTRLFNEYELADLKVFLTATVNWIQSELIADRALDIAPRK